MSATARTQAMWLRALLACGLLALAGPPVAAQEQSVRPGINRHYDNADFERWRATFESPGREVYDRREAIAAAAGVQPGMAVADVGAGTGLFSLLFAQMVGPRGRVYAQDITPGFIGNIARRAREQGLANLVTVQGGERDARLPEASVDLVFLCDVYHHFEYPRSMLASLRRALRPGGSLVVVDYQRIPGVSSSWVLGHVRLGKEEAIREIEAAGFRLAESPALLQENYFLRFELQP